eukprot:CAMPEP_0202836452 /NCGR_PEP_ID=MMETSP1389-20130828/41422_1 /ASSEMBLY_ACC=CAM_ASM_000865 /TAXON_ID=302021 /ORGANISM="Rhodomonas sp., Strain CCMP768" /LENGTH=76 /DNA_ID=CAMNT_0049512251 /DNA_START=8 /DNA_END=235 /DNA_ORIENTATION=+
MCEQEQAPQQLHPCSREVCYFPERRYAPVLCMSAVFKAALERATDSIAGCEDLSLARRKPCYPRGWSEVGIAQRFD